MEKIIILLLIFCLAFGSANAISLGVSVANKENPKDTDIYFPNMLRGGYSEKHIFISSNNDYPINVIVTTPAELENTKPVYHLYVIQVENRDRLQGKLSDAGIASGIHYPYSLHLTPAYKYLELKKGSFPMAEKCADRFLSLPMYPELTESMIKTVCDAIEKNL